MIDAVRYYCGQLTMTGKILVARILKFNKFSVCMLSFALLPVLRLSKMGLGGYQIDVPN